MGGCTSIELESVRLQRRRCTRNISLNLFFEKYISNRFFEYIAISQFDDIFSFVEDFSLFIVI